MAAYEQRISLDLSKRDANRQTAYIGTGDHCGTKVVATVYDNGVPAALSGADVSLIARLVDGSAIEKPCTVSGSKATCEIDASSLGGNVMFAYLSVVSDEQTYSTETFDIVTLEGVSV